MQLDVELANDDGRALDFNYRYELFAALQRIHSAAPEKSPMEADQYRGCLKLFTFSPLNSLPYPESVKLSDGRPAIRFSGRIWMRLAGMCPSFLGSLGESLLAARAIQVRGVRFHVVSIQFVPTPEFSERMLYKPYGQSGAFVCRYLRGSRAFYQLPDDRVPGIPGCVELLTATLRHKLMLAGKVCPNLGFSPELHKEPIHIEIFPVSREIAFRTTLVRLKNESAQGFRAPVLVTAPIAIHRLIWSSGLGNQNSWGFGLVRPGHESDTGLLNDPETETADDSSDQKSGATGPAASGS